jgi:ribonuclease HI
LLLEEEEKRGVMQMIEVYIDGASEPVNPGGIATYGFVIYRDGERIDSGCGRVEEKNTSNNVAEYAALIRALEKIVERKISNERIIFRSDSELLINQLNGAYAVRAPRIVPLFERVKVLVAELESLGNRLQFAWIPRELNQEADALSIQAYEEFCEAHPEVIRRYDKYLATEKQKQFMRKLGITFSKWISKRAASKLIDEKLEELRSR